jgi:hypothetical protein
VKRRKGKRGKRRVVGEGKKIAYFVTGREG